MVQGCFCTNTSLFFDQKIPLACCGLDGKQTICCCYSAWCLSPNMPLMCCEAPTDAYCQCGLGLCALGCTKPVTCCASHTHSCCIVQSGAFPPSEKNPCTLAWCFVHCWPRCGICSTIRQIQGGGDDSDMAESLCPAREGEHLLGAPKSADTEAQ